MCVRLAWGKDLEEFDKSVERMTLILRDGRRCGAKRVYIAGDFNTELGLLCAGIEEDEELCGMFGPHCWHGYGIDTGGFKKMMWYNIMKEFHCKATSTWLSCDERKEMAFTHKQWGKNGRTSKVDYILGSKTHTSVTCVHNGVTLCSTWDHFLVYVVILKGEEGRSYIKKEKAWVGWQPRDEDARKN